MIEIHKLGADEYPALCQIADGFNPDPKCSVALLAKDGEEVLGRIFLVAPVHLEGPWVREDARGRAILWRLVERAREEAKAMGITRLLAFGAGAQMEDYLKRADFKKLNLTVWAKEI